MNSSTRRGDVLAVTVVLGAVVTPLAAQADVPRNQIQTLSYSVTVQGGYTHSYTVHPNPCGPDFTGTGQYPAAPATPTYNEAFTGVTGNQPAAGVPLTYTDSYFDPTSGHALGYTYTFTGAFTDSIGDFSGTISDSNGNSGLITTGTFVGATSTSFRNHGDYVSSLPASQRAAAASSCVGMPVQSH